MDYSKPATPAEVCAEAEALIENQIKRLSAQVRSVQAKIEGLVSALEEVAVMGHAFARYQPKEEERVAVAPAMGEANCVDPFE